ncbi:MAG: hypothetical protein ACSW8D_01490 [Prevotella sp.]
MKNESHMGWRGPKKNYRWPGTYHITINVMNRKQLPLGYIEGDVSKPYGDPLAPRVHLSEIGRMVEQELLVSIRKHYPMVEVQDYVVMPDHLHFIVVVHRVIYSSNGRETHLGQIIAGFKKGCNRRYWEITGQTGANQQGEPADTGRQGLTGDDTPVVPAEDCSTCISKADGSCKIACLMEEKKRRESNKTPNDDV